MNGITKTDRSPFARLRSVDLKAARWRPGFWADRFERLRTVTLPHLWDLMDDPARGHALTNLRIAAGEMEGEFAGTHWQDEWVYKWIEGASYVVGQTGDPDLDARMDEAIRVIARAQQPDGYLATQTIVRGWPRFERPQHHEVYVMGHLLSAACAHYRMTGKTTFLDVARKVGDYLHATFKPPRPPELEHKIFNPSQIMGLAELYRTTGEPRYLEAARFFVDYHGATPGGSDQMQDRVPLREETQVVGHMVLSTYLYAGATDVVLETGDESLLHALDRLWHDLTEKRMYVHGGVAPVHRGHSVRPREVIARHAPAGNASLQQQSSRPAGEYPAHLIHRHLDDVHEAAGDDYELPNGTAYNETCAQIGNVLWNWRLLEATGHARHAEIMELSLYNSVISGVGLDGRSWFYTNPLRFYGRDHKLLSQDAYERFQPGRVHVCCPSNLTRAEAGVHGYLYARSDDGLALNLYAASDFDGTLPDGSRLALTQETDYPWDGTVTLTIRAAPERPIALLPRIPSWAGGVSIAVNGHDAAVAVQPGSYARVERAWRAGDVVTLHLPMAVRLLEGNHRIETTRNQVAVARGPLIYCLESPDLPEGVRLSDVHLPPDATLAPRHRPDLLGGVTVLEGEAEAVPGPDWQHAEGLAALYRPLERATPTRCAITFIPYFAWANRGVSEMSVWLPLAVRR
ncbi:MAG TPA: beta-L-arabinofuranosidase domain-containing protein [Chloroflexota bacterium]|nr:beta-L-arabinofuranosidase domain-containing protein [Chloroflexota bacterium]